MLGFYPGNTLILPELKYLISILILVFGINFTLLAQQNRTAPQEPQAKIVKYYQSPSATSMVFELQSGYDKSYSLQLYNFMGKRVYEIKFATQRMNISLANMYRGIYVYQLRDKNGVIVESGKFQVIK